MFKLSKVLSEHQCTWCHFCQQRSAATVSCSQHFTCKGRGSSSWLNWCSNTTAASTLPDRGSFLTKSSKCSSVSNPRTEGKAQEERDIYKTDSTHIHLFYVILILLASIREEWLTNAYVHAFFDNHQIRKIVGAQATVRKCKVVMPSKTKLFLFQPEDVCSVIFSASWTAHETIIRFSEQMSIVQYVFQG